MVPSQKAAGLESSTEGLTSLEKEYDLVNANFRQLSEIRFKLLGFVPALGGVANFVLTQAALSKGSSQGNYWVALVFGTLGFLATLGIAMYDQRNSELYFGLIDRAKYLEGCLRLPHTTNKDEYGGQFRERPNRGRRLFRLILISHGGSLAVIYGPVLGAWFFPMIYSVLELAHQPYHRCFNMAVGGAILMTIVFIIEFLRLAPPSNASK
jgi:hypothetical protein